MKIIKSKNFSRFELYDLFLRKDFIKRQELLNIYVPGWESIESMMWYTFFQKIKLNQNQINQFYLELKNI